VLTNELQKRADVRRGQRAKAILDDEVFQEAIRGIHADCMADFESSKPEEHIKREQAHQDLMATKRVLSKLQKFMFDGRVAAQDIEREEQKKEKQKHG